VTIALSFSANIETIVLGFTPGVWLPFSSFLALYQLSMAALKKITPKLSSLNQHYLESVT
jgi:hypothetical protein